MKKDLYFVLKQLQNSLTAWRKKALFTTTIAYLTFSHIILLRIRSNTLCVQFWSCLELQSFQQTKETKKTFYTAFNVDLKNIKP